VSQHHKILDVGIRLRSFLAAPYIVFDRNMVLLKNFSVILVYTSYSLFNYIRESSSIWSYTHTFLQNTKGKGVGHETKIVGLRDLHYIRLDTPNFVTHGCAYDPPCFGCSRVLASVSQQCLCLREKYLDPILR